MGHGGNKEHLWQLSVLAGHRSGRRFVGGKSGKRSAGPIDAFRTMDFHAHRLGGTEGRDSRACMRQVQKSDGFPVLACQGKSHMAQ